MQNNLYSLTWRYSHVNFSSTSPFKKAFFNIRKFSSTSMVMKFFSHDITKLSLIFHIWYQETVSLPSFPLPQMYIKAENNQRRKYVYCLWQGEKSWGMKSKDDFWGRRLWGHAFFGHEDAARYWSVWEKLGLL